jgi:hypothetical protein
MQEKERGVHKNTQKVLQTQGISLSTSGTHRSISRVPPDHSRRDPGRAGKHEGRRKNGEWRMQKVRAASEVLQGQRVTRSRWAHCRNTTRGNAETGSPQLGHFPCLREGERPREPKLLPTSGKSGLARTLALPAEISLAYLRPKRDPVQNATAFPALGASVA